MENNHPKYKEVHLQEIPKIIEIRDGLNNLWYKVILKVDPASYESVELKLMYQVKVLNYRFDPSNDNPILIVDRPEPNEAKIYDYNVARKMFDDYVRDYQAVVKAQTRDIQTIDVYAEKIGYHMTCPACCGTCKHCFKTKTHNDFYYHVTGFLECHNPENQKEYDFNREIPENPRRFGPGRDREMMEMHPKVYFLGVCKRYEKRTQPWRFHDGESIGQFIDTKTDNRFRDLPNEQYFVDGVQEVVQSDDTIDKIAKKIDIDRIYGDQEQYEETVIGFMGDDRI